MNIAVLGSQNGDEGKGHIVHHLSKDFDWVVRFAGGANAGHTIYRDKVKYVHNLLPSFDWRIPNVKAFLGSGMVIDLEQLWKEVGSLQNIYTLEDRANRVYVDPDAFVVLPQHKEEDKFTNRHIGSTNRGIGPAYRDKVARKGIRIKELLNQGPENYYLDSLIKMGVQFKHVLELKHQMESANLLFEGAQGVMLDINHGVYPYVSCGDSTIAGIYVSGFAWVKLDRVYGVAKCYLTKVGEGPFPTEIHGKEADDLRERGKEYGATTGRPRRIGWIDLPALNYACQKAGITDLIMTKFDILDGMEKIPVCVFYNKEPMCPSDFVDAQPQYINFPGWKNSKELKGRELYDFIRQIERATECRVRYLSCGIDTEDILSW